VARNSNTSGIANVRPSSMDAFDKLPKAVRLAMHAADHNWSGEQLYRAYRKRNAKARNTAAMLATIRLADAELHIKTATDTSGIMPGQRSLVEG
jgi:hypothetical protein